ncbi:MAG: glycoside hydrolase family 13 protein [Flavobacterium sp.]|uniref:Glycoside hydrolase family 13 protein n=1 Tax=Flavobacterium celericrescens TaxID=2709780 RepID=A0ABX0ICS6_9FLAO|nr:glycoside hydrolase family 13 protein [Flavobacterium celericrescens]NHM04867.1 glycoside hydrolase family 13 protein [Flavobacterium celericrescens]
MKKIIFFLLLTTYSFAQVDRMEPPFWWSDMNYSDVQIMFYGKNIAQNEISVSNGIVIKGIQKTENPNYVFVTIDTKNIPTQDFVFTFKNKNKSFTQQYSIKSRRENSRNRKSFDSSDLIYLIMSDRFANGNTNNDNTKETIEKVNRSNKDGRHGGDIEGIIKNLDYIKELGATAIWPTPLCEDNDERGSYHTYGQSDVYKIDSRFGTNEDYLRLSAELHKRGMKNIMDYVTNHWGYNHWMMKDLPTYEWIHQFPGYAQTNYRMASQFDVNASKKDSNLCMDGWFVKSMPDLNQSNPLVLNYLTQNAIWWIEYADLDGFRVDTYSYNDKTAIAKWTKSITDEYPNFNIVGEVWMYDQAQMAYWQKDSKIGAIQSYNSNLPSVMDFTLQEAIHNGAFNEDKQEWRNGIVKVYENFNNDFLYPNINNLLVFFENHDTNRINHIYNNDFKKYQMALTLIATVRGIPQVYYGSEIGMAGDKGLGDGDIRRDFPGGWTGDKNNAFLKSERTAEQEKFHAFTSKLFNWRKNKTVIHTGKTTHYIPENNVYVYFRYNEKESVMVIVNNNPEKQVFKTNRFSENIKNFKTGIDVLTSVTMDLKNDISIDGKSVLILELK